MDSQHSFYRRFFEAYHKNLLASLSWKFVIALSLLGVYAPLFASSKPILVQWNGVFYSPLLRYLWFPGFYTKSIDLFFNVLMVVLPLLFFVCRYCRGRRRQVFVIVLCLAQLMGFFMISRGGIQDPAVDRNLKKLRAEKILPQMIPHQAKELMSMPEDLRSWEAERRYMSQYEQLGLLIKAKYHRAQHERLQKYRVMYEGQRGSPMPTLHYQHTKNEHVCLDRLHKRLKKMEPAHAVLVQDWQKAIEVYRPFMMALERIDHDLQLAAYHGQERESLQASYAAIESASSDHRQNLLALHKRLEEYNKVQSAIRFIQDKRAWIDQESQKVRIWIRPLLSAFHWEDDAGGSREMNKYVRWWELTRINRKDLMSSLIFGIRIVLVVGGVSVAIALIIGTIIGLISGYFGGVVDIVLSRFTEIWETTPVLFILMLVVSVVQVKSLILNTILLGCFGWTGFSRYIRGETLKQRNLPYVLAATNMCYSHYHIMIHQILPNAIVPIIALLPFSVMAMISCEAGLTFLGLGEENSASWGNIMREGVSAFPSESAILWPPAIVLTVLLIAIALIGDGIRDAIDPKLQE